MTINQTFWSVELQSAGYYELEAPSQVGQLLYRWIEELGITRSGIPWARYEQSELLSRSAQCNKSIASQHIHYEEWLHTFLNIGGNTGLLSGVAIFIARNRRTIHQQSLLDQLHLGYLTPEEEGILLVRGHLFTPDMLQQIAQLFPDSDQRLSELTQAHEADFAQWKNQLHERALNANTPRSFIQSLSVYFDHPNFKELLHQYYHEFNLGERGVSYDRFVNLSIPNLEEKRLPREVLDWVENKFHLQEHPELKERFDRFMRGGPEPEGPRKLSDLEIKRDQLLVGRFAGMLRHGFTQSGISEVAFFNQTVGPQSQLDPSILNLRLTPAAVKANIGNEDRWPTAEQFTRLRGLFEDASNATQAPRKPWFDGPIVLARSKDASVFSREFTMEAYEAASAARTELLAHGVNVRTRY